MIYRFGIYKQTPILYVQSGSFSEICSLIKTSGVGIVFLEIKLRESLRSQGLTRQQVDGRWIKYVAFNATGGMYPDLVVEAISSLSEDEFNRFVGRYYTADMDSRDLSNNGLSIAFRKNCRLVAGRLECIPLFICDKDRAEAIRECIVSNDWVDGRFMRPIFYRSGAGYLITL